VLERAQSLIGKNLNSFFNKASLWVYGTYSKRTKPQWSASGRYHRALVEMSQHRRFCFTDLRPSLSNVCIMSDLCFRKENFPTLISFILLLCEQR